MAGSIDPKEFGQLQAKVELLQKSVDEMRADMKELLAAVENARGGWKTLMLLGGASAAFGGFLMKLLPVIGKG